MKNIKTNIGCFSLLLMNIGFDKKPTISVLHQLIRNGNAFLRVKRTTRTCINYW